MNSLFDVATASTTMQIFPLIYRETNAIMAAEISPAENDLRNEDLNQLAASLGPSEAEIETMLHEAREQSAVAARAQVWLEVESSLALERDRTANAISAFDAARRKYFTDVEESVVKLSLSIAAKILQREVHLDPMLLSGLVRVALEKVQDGSSVLVKIPHGQSERWTSVFNNVPRHMRIEVEEDLTLNAGDCIVQTMAGSAQFGIEAQLQEVELGFFDLLSRRPAIS